MKMTTLSVAVALFAVTVAHQEKIKESIEEDVESMWSWNPFHHVDNNDDTADSEEPASNGADSTNDHTESETSQNSIPEPETEEVPDHAGAEVQTDGDINNTQFDGNCVACVTAGQVYCMDGDNMNLNKNVQEYGSCQPSKAHCDSDGLFSYDTKTYYMQCDYQDVKNPITGNQFPDSVIEIEITDDMTTSLQNDDQTEPTLLDLYFHEDAYQVLHIQNNQTTISELSLRFSGVFGDDLYDEKQNDPRIINGRDLNLLQVYFTNQVPTEFWGQPSQFDYQENEEPQSITDYGDDMYVIIANPSTYGYRMQVYLANYDAIQGNDSAVYGFSMAAAVVAMLLQSLITNLKLFKMVGIQTEFIISQF